MVTAACCCAPVRGRRDTISSWRPLAPPQSPPPQAWGIFYFRCPGLGAAPARIPACFLHLMHRHWASLLIQESLWEPLAWRAGRCNLLPLLSCKDVNLSTTARRCF